MKEKKSMYPKVDFTRQLIENDTVVQMNMYTIVTESQEGEEVEVELVGYYPYDGELSRHSEFAFCQTFHQVCAVTYIHGEGAVEELGTNENSSFKWDVDDLEMGDDGREE